jgi:hypothetical protein
MGVEPVNRLLCSSALLVVLAGALAHPSAADPHVLPAEPVEIGTEPQFVFDNYVIDNRWALKYKRESVGRAFHPPEKHPENPLIRGDGGSLSVVKDESGRFRLWYQTWEPSTEKGKAGKYAIAYAESADGIAWELPKLGQCEWKGTKENNIVWTGIHGRRASSPFLLDLPDKERRGYRFVMLYRETDGMRLVGSHDGIHWDKSSDVLISPIHSDTQNAIVYDPLGGQYLMYCRAKHVYRTFRGDVLDTGASRRIARMNSNRLWTAWESEPQTILIPDELDEQSFNFFYGMPTRIYGGVYWGFLWAFKMNTDIHTELAFSRDGVRFDRLPHRPKLIERGPEGAWDHGMVFGSSSWVEVGDQWWIYYAGWDGPHETRDRTPGIGLARLRKEGFISVHGPPGGGVLVTRKIRWPGGNLLLNADARGGQLTVRVSDARRKVLPGFGYDDCLPLDGDGVAQQVTWQNASLASLTGQVIRLEFLLQNADLYTFRASSPGG